MRTTQLKANIDSVNIAEADVKVLGDEVVLVGRYTMHDSRTGGRFGLGNRNVWSPGTITLLRQLLDSMEDDIMAATFEGYAAGGGEGPVTTTSPGVPSL